MVVVDLYLNMEKTMESGTNTHKGNKSVVLVKGFFKFFFCLVLMFKFHKVS